MVIALNKNSNPEAFLPQAESRLFDASPRAQYWIGQIATGNLVILPNEYTAAHILRANIYIDEEKYLPSDSRCSDGGEYDEYDERSVQFAILENNPTELKLVVGTSRLIFKRDEQDALPVENLFPEYFTDNPAEVGSVEGSRLIALHPERKAQHRIALANIRAMDLYSLHSGAKSIYGVSEEKLLKTLSRMGFPFEQLTDFKPLGEFGDTQNAAIKFNPQEVIKSVGTDLNGRAVLSRFFAEAVSYQGLGYFDADFNPVRP